MTFSRSLSEPHFFMIFGDFGWLWGAILGAWDHLWPPFWRCFFRSDFPLHFFHCQAASAVTGGGGREPREALIRLDSGKLGQGESQTPNVSSGLTRRILRASPPAASPPNSDMRIYGYSRIPDPDSRSGSGFS